MNYLEVSELKTELPCRGGLKKDGFKEKLTMGTHLLMVVAGFELAIVSARNVKNK